MLFSHYCSALGAAVLGAPRLNFVLEGGMEEIVSALGRDGSRQGGRAPARPSCLLRLRQCLPVMENALLCEAGRGGLEGYT